MIVPPIIERELRVTLRKHQAVRSRFRTAAIGVGVVCLFLIFGLLANDASGVSRGLYEVLFYGGLYMAVLPPLRISVGLFCEEHRNQTLELLYLTGMGSGELFGSKLLGGMLIASSDLLAVTPLFAVPFLSGGLSFDLFRATIICLPVMLLFTGAVGTLASVLSRDDGGALVWALALASVVCLLVPFPYQLGIIVTGSAPFSPFWLCLSPAYGPYLVATNFAGPSPALFWLTAEATMVWSIAVLVLAAGLLNRNWRQDIQRAATGGWSGKWQSLLRGSVAWRAALRERLLPQNPFQWLAQQDRQPMLLAWSLVAGVSLVWLAGWTAWPRAWPSPMNYYITALVLLLGVDGITTYAAARRIGIERREGTLELLLTTPLAPEEIVEGQLAALRAQFRPIRHALLALCLLMMFGGFLTRTWNWTAVISYFLIWCVFLGWCLHVTRQQAPRAMWIALNTGRATLALFHSSRGQGGWFWWMWWFFNLKNLSGGLVSAGMFPSGSVFELVMVILLVLVILIVALARSHFPMVSRRRLVNEMRFIVREPLMDPRDPGFKQWFAEAMRE